MVDTRELLERSFEGETAVYDPAVYCVEAFEERSRTGCIICQLLLIEWHKRQAGAFNYRAGPGLPTLLDLSREKPIRPNPSVNSF